jgi:hypothetical protein
MKRLAFRWPQIQAPRQDVPLPPLRTRLMWMALIWSGSVAVLLVVAMLLRLVLKA